MPAVDTTRIAGKVAVITGASSGIGSVTARLLAQRGAKVVLGARRTDRLEQLALSIEQQGGDTAYRQTDVSRRGDLVELVSLATERYGQLDVLINNAGVMPVSGFDDLRVEDWDTMIDVNLKGVLYGIAAALPVFRAQGFGQFVNTASTSAHRIVANQGIYAATKIAVRTLSEALRQEAGPDLRVTVISPGFTDTDGVGAGVPDRAVKEQMRQSRESIAMPPEAVADAIAYAIGQPAGVDIGEIVVRPTAQS